MNCPAFIARSFALRTAAHLLHLSSTSYAQHVALNEFYDALTPLVDDYAEVYMGLEGRIKSFPAISPPAGAPVDLLNTYLDLIKTELAEDDSTESLKNILAEIEAITARAIYKLQNLK